MFVVADHFSERGRDLIGERVNASHRRERRQLGGILQPQELGLKVPQRDQRVAESIAEARQLGGTTTTAANPASALQGIVSLDPKLRGKVAPGDTVFVLARPAEGSKMPLAVVRTTVDKLPYSFTLDDSMAMAAGATISRHAKVVVVARVSRSGNAMPQKGDIEGVSAPIAPGASGVNISLSRLID